MHLSTKDMKTKKQIDMVEGPLSKNIIAYTIPVMLTGVLQLLFNAADLIIVGRFGDESSIAAVGATGSIIGLIVNLFMGMSVGTGVTVAHAVGAGHEKDARDAVHTAIPLAAIGGLVIMAIGIPLSRPLLTLMQNPPDVIGKSTLYMQIYFAGLVGNLVFNFGASILRAVGDTKSPMIYLTLAGFVNVGLNIVFVTLFHLDVAGVALATIISQALSAVLVLIELSKRTDCCKLELKRLRIKSRPLKKMLLIGVPSGIQSALFAISNVLIQSSINGFGSTVMAGHSAAASIEGFLYTAQNSFYQASVNFVSQNYGARKLKRVLQVSFRCLLFAGLTGIILGALSLTFSKQLLGIYISGNPEAIKYGMIRMSILSSTYFLCGPMEVSTGMLRGIGKSAMPMIASILGVCVFRVGWVMTIFKVPAFHTLECLYTSYPISWALTTTVQLTLFFIVFNKIKRKSKESNI